MSAIGQCQRLHSKLLFAVESQGGATGHQHGQVGADAEQLCELWRGLRQLFEVVEQQQEVLLLKMQLEAFKQATVAAFQHSQHMGQRGQDKLRIAEGSQGDIEDYIRKLVEQRIGSAKSRKGYGDVTR